MNGKSLFFCGACLLGRSNWKQTMNSAFLRVMMKTNTPIGRNFCDVKPKLKLPPIHPDCYITSSIFTALKAQLLFNSITPMIDKTFDTTEFLVGAVKAQKVVSYALMRNDFEFLEDMVAKEALDSIKDNVTNLTLEERNLIRIEDQDIVNPTVQDVTIKNKEGNMKVVEILVVTKYCKSVIHEDMTGLKFLEKLNHIADNTFLCNYNFIRKYKEDITSDWGINFVNHFQLRPDYPY